LWNSNTSLQTTRLTIMACRGSSCICKLDLLILILLVLDI
jgi:hypothetical protein